MPISAKSIFTLLLSSMLGMVLFTPNPTLVRGQSLSSKPSQEFDEDHRAEAQKWYEEQSNPLHEPNPSELNHAAANDFLHMANRPAMKSAKASAWQQVGGSQDGNVSGRTTSIAFDPHDPQILYLATAEGGLWKTTDGGQVWVPLSAKWATQNMGAVAVDPNNTQIVYACTGDAWGAEGIGMYRSVDAGLNWQLVATSSQIGLKSSGMLVDPDNSYAFMSGDAGVYRSIDTGRTWVHVRPLGGITNLIMDPVDHAVLYAAASAGIWKSVNYGSTWRLLHNTGISEGNLLTLGISVHNHLVVYASAGGSSGDLFGLFRSDDSGANWSRLGTNVNYLGRQGWYANSLVVDPSNENNIFVGGVDIYRSTNGGQTLDQLTQWGTSSGSSNFTHADIHVLVFNPYLDPNAGVLYALTDGGIYHSETNGISWSGMNRTLATLQFVSADAAQDMNFVAGGTQDNGVNRASLGANYFHFVLGGDGGYTYVGQGDDLKGSIVYSTYIGADLHKSNDGGVTWQRGPRNDNNILSNTPLMNDLRYTFYMRYGICESNPSVIALCGNSQLWLSTTGGDDNFKAVTSTIRTDSNYIEGSPTTVHIPRADESTIYLATSAGYIYHTNDQGLTWSRSKTATPSVTGIYTNPVDASHVYASVGGFGSTHLLVSTDTGITFTNPAKNIPKGNYKCIVEAPDSMLYMGSSVGVIRSADQGRTWYPLADGIPVVDVTSLVVRGVGPYYLVAATYGHGIYMLNLNDLPPIQPDRVSTQPIAVSASITSTYPNPVVHASAQVQFSIAEPGTTKLSVFDEVGRETKVLLNEYLAKGNYSRDFDLTGLPSGKYYYALTSLGHREVKAFSIDR